ncbi:unannotated protein [freshwater metagenome]|uniref:Unannotated protein n=1 Tax=freshwater metagenome TaxID=449393 RepID=A0A6J6Z4F1_9ZZZZ
MIAGSSGSMFATGIGVSAGTLSSADAYTSVRAGSTCGLSARRVTRVSTSAAESAAETRIRRSWSTMSTFAPQSRRPYSISSGCQSAFIATAIAPTLVTAMNEMIHSG